MYFLILDSNPNTGSTLGRLIEAEGHEIVHASTLRGAIRKANEVKATGAFLSWDLEEGHPKKYLEALTGDKAHLPTIAYTERATVQDAKDALRLGAEDYLQLPLEPAAIRELIGKLAEKKAADGPRKQPRAGSRAEPGAEPAEDDKPLEAADATAAAHGQPALIFDSRDPSVEAPFKKAWKAAASETNVLLLGPSGAGKTVLAQEMHRRSRRANGPFVTLHCPSLSRELLESELFGHVKGAFTGAIRDSEGKAAAAHGGTLFLDEIGEIPMEIQPKLLRLIQEKQYERVGDTMTRTADVRFICATNKDLSEEVKAKNFREDLFYRIAVVSVEMPGLSERPGDILRFARHYLKYFAEKEGRPNLELTEKAERELQAYSWPGNLRELRNVIESAVVLSEKPQLESQELSVADEATTAFDGERKEGCCAGDFVSLDALSEEHIRRILERTDTMEEAASVLGINSATLYRKRKRMQQTS
jgi:NtrC-family two-component system response regulator AlgB